MYLPCASHLPSGFQPQLRIEPLTDEVPNFDSQHTCKYNSIPLNGTPDFFPCSCLFERQAVAWLFMCFHLSHLGCAQQAVWYPHGERSPIQLYISASTRHDFGDYALLSCLFLGLTPSPTTWWYFSRRLRLLSIVVYLLPPALSLRRSQGFLDCVSAEDLCVIEALVTSRSPWFSQALKVGR